MFGTRSGREPATARSPLHLRLVLAGFGAIVLMAAAIIAFTRESASVGLLVLGTLSAVFAVIAAIDFSVVMAELKAAQRSHGHRPHHG